LAAVTRIKRPSAGKRQRRKSDTGNLQGVVAGFSGSNTDNVLHVMDTYIEKMQEFRRAIAEFDEEGIRGLIEDANRIKKIIR